MGGQEISTAQRWTASYIRRLRVSQQTKADQDGESHMLSFLLWLQSQEYMQQLSVRPHSCRDCSCSPSLFHCSLSASYSTCSFVWRLDAIKMSLVESLLKLSFPSFPWHQKNPHCQSPWSPPQEYVTVFSSCRLCNVPYWHTVLPSYEEIDQISELVWRSWTLTLSVAFKKCVSLCIMRINHQSEQSSIRCQAIVVWIPPSCSVQRCMCTWQSIQTREVEKLYPNFPRATNTSL